MDSSVVGLVGVVLVALIAETVGIFLRRPLGILLKAEKGIERSDFWSAYTRVVLVLVPAACALLGFPTGLHLDPVLALVQELRWAMALLLIALGIAGRSLQIPAPPRRVAPDVPPVIPPVPFPPTHGPVR